MPTTQARFCTCLVAGWAVWMLACCGCYAPSSRQPVARIYVARVQPADLASDAAVPETENPIRPVSGQTSQQAERASEVDRSRVDDGSPDKQPSPQLDDVIQSIHSTFPLLEAALQQAEIAAGEQMAAWGSFDTRFESASQNSTLGFYNNFRQQAAVAQPIFGGGEFFGGYRIGRGDFQPWYLERQTNDGGEFLAGVQLPLLRNREIDDRRASLWRATYDRQRAEPLIRIQLIQFVRDGSVAYWRWVATVRKYEIGKQALELAEQRNAQLKRKVEVGDIDPPVLQDNLRAIAAREAKLIDLRRKREQAGIRLSLFLRKPDGTPTIPPANAKPDFPPPLEVTADKLESALATALLQRPELASLDALAGRVEVDLAAARNRGLPAVDAQLIGSQDVGAPASSTRDKSQFELEAGVFVEVPVQRRKARGKSQAAIGKLIQIAAKRRFTEDKIRTDVKAAYAAWKAAFERLSKARESKRLANELAAIERRKFELGGSDLLSVVLREQFAIEAAEAEVDALLEYYSAKADFDAAQARDWPANE